MSSIAVAVLYLNQKRCGGDPRPTDARAKQQGGGRKGEEEAEEGRRWHFRESKKFVLAAGKGVLGRREQRP